MIPPDAQRVNMPPRATDETSGRDHPRRELWEGLDTWSLMTVELLAGILVWGGIGWLLDGWLGTKPWLFAVGTLAGFAAGLYLVWLRSQREQRRQ